MKSKDFALIGVIVFISAIISLFASKAIFSSKIGQQQAPMVQAITSDFSKPDSTYFNSNSVDPTKLITIGQSNTTDPFNGTSQ